MKSFFAQLTGGIAIIVASTLIGVVVNAFRPGGVPLVPSGAPVSTARHNGPKAAADTSSAGEEAKLPEGAISLAEAKRRFDAGNSVFIDARSPEEYDQGHIPGAINIPHDRIPEYFDILNSQVPTDADVVIYCRGPACEFSDQLATELKLMDYRHVSVFSGGWEQWTLAGYPTEGTVPK